MFLVAIESLTAESFVNSMSALLFRKIVEGTVDYDRSARLETSGGLLQLF